MIFARDENAKLNISILFMQILTCKYEQVTYSLVLRDSSQFESDSQDEKTDTSPRKRVNAGTRKKKTNKQNQTNKMSIFGDKCEFSPVYKKESELLKIKNVTVQIKCMPISEIWKSKTKNSLRKQSKKPERRT